jgi:hypothetical protein
MAKAGMEKLHAHAEEHLSGGVYDDPTPAMVNFLQQISTDCNTIVSCKFKFQVVKLKC